MLDDCERITGLIRQVRTFLEGSLVFDFASTIIAALIGSIIGSVGAVVTNYWLTGRSEKFHRREILVQRYLFQLQDALDMLGHRLKNLAERGARTVMSDEYFEVTTLYAFGRVLAIERILALEAVYPQLDSIYPGLGKLLQERQYLVGPQLQSKHFYQYDRVALAEVVIIREGDIFRASTYLEFRKIYEMEDSSVKEWLQSAKATIQHLSTEQENRLIDVVRQKSLIIAEKTNISNSMAMHP